MLKGILIVENSDSVPFTLSIKEVEALEREAAEVRRTVDGAGDYNFLHELAGGVLHNGIALLIEKQCKNEETPAGGAAREST